MLAKAIKSLERSTCILGLQFRCFAGKTELPYRYKTPSLKLRSVEPIYPPPGLNLQLPGKGFCKCVDWTPDYFLKQIGGDCGEYGDKFKNIQEIFGFTPVSKFSRNV